MKLIEGSVILVNLTCGCVEKRVTIMEGRQDIRCPNCGRLSYIYFKTNSDGSFRLVTDAP